VCGGDEAMITPFATRAHNHNFKFDPIIRSLLDCDWYKPAMQQFIWKYFPQTQVSFSLINRKKSIRLVDDIDEQELRRQLDHVRTLKFAKSELIWLAGNTFYGMRGIFCSEFLKWLEDFRLPEYTLTQKDGQWELVFDGRWVETTMWELYALSIINELRTRSALSKLSEFELDILYSKAKTKLWSKIQRLKGVPGLKFADFGTRRRHSFLWQEYAVTAMASELPDVFMGTSNVYLAFKHNLEAIGTNAHELPMTLAALARLGKLGDMSLKESQYEVLRLWKEMYGGALLVALPDTFGTTQFLNDAPDWVAKEYSGFRLDSKDPYVGGEEVVDFFQRANQDVSRKLIIPSDGLDVDDVLGLHAQFGGVVREGYDARKDFKNAQDFLNPQKWTHTPRIRISSGWGTLLTNDFRDCHPRGRQDFDPISLVCKVKEVEGHPAVKLSDNYTKATGESEEIQIYRETFGTEGVHGIPVLV
jgi:nicotinate phosphoribosyltransferase